jgi:MerR family mercuric resistance operon transcriptional regulator
MRQNSDSEGTRATIGMLSKQTGCNTETIRYYERVGLLPAPPRTEGGHRVYGEAHTKRLTFIRRSRELGFTLGEVRGLLQMVDGEHYTCADVKNLALDHLKEVRGKLANLKKLEKVLKQLADRCTGNETPDCPIVEALFEQPDPGA